MERSSAAPLLKEKIRTLKDAGCGGTPNNPRAGFQLVKVMGSFRP
jgi:hypothetical protein